jgi:hypothetical protein
MLQWRRQGERWRHGGANNVLWGRCGGPVKERKGVMGGTHMSVSEEWESTRAILVPYENMMICRWIHIVYGRRKLHILSFG